MRRRLLSLFTASVLGLAGLGVYVPKTAEAVTGADWQAGRIIDDGVFTQKNAMSVSAIQNFLNQKVGTGGYASVPGQCDTQGVRSAQPFSNSSRAQYAASLGRPTTFTCLNNYYEVPKLNPGPGIPASNYGGAPIPAGAKSAAQLIWDAAQRYNINPQVLLVTIQKESAGPLTTDDWPFQKQFTYAMGAHCPDSGPGGAANCDSNYAGFSIQISESAELLRYYLDSMNQPWWPYKKLGQNSILYQNAKPECGSSVVNITTMATAALYTYTPYQPNKAALDNLYGLGDGCSAYGNRNFWRIFSDWFGSTQFPQPAGGSLYRSDAGGIYLVVEGTRYYIPSWDLLNDYKLVGFGTISASDSQLNSLTNGGNLTNLIWNSNGVFMVNNGTTYHVSGAMCTAWGFDCYNSNSQAVKNLGQIFVDGSLTYGGSLPEIGAYDGVVYKMSAGSKLPIANGQTIWDLGYGNTPQISLNKVNASQPLGQLLLSKATLITFKPSGAIYYYNGQNYYSVPTWDVMQAWGFDKKPVFVPPTSSYNTNLPVSSGSLGIWFQDGSSKYLVDNGRRFLLDGDLQTYWPSATYLTFDNNPGKVLPVSTLQPFISSGSAIYQLKDGQKRHVPSFNDTRLLGVNSNNLTSLSTYAATLIPTGPLALGTGSLVKNAENNGIYVVAGNTLLYIPSSSLISDFNFDGSATQVFTSNALTGYPIAGELKNTVLSNGNYAYVKNGSLISISAAQIDSYGIQTNLYQVVPQSLLAGLITKSLTPFVYNRDTGGIYYGSGGSTHHVTTQAAFTAHGGNNSNLTYVNTDFLDATTIGPSL